MSYSLTTLLKRVRLFESEAIHTLAEDGTVWPEGKFFLAVAQQYLNVNC